MNSIETQIPFSYYYLNISYPDKLEKEDEGLSELFTGDYNYKTNYQVHVNQDEYCKYLDTKIFTQYDTYLFRWMIDRDYRINFNLDKLPAGYNFTQHFDVHYYSGIPIGFKRQMANETVWSYVLYNHYTFTVHVNKNNGKYSIVEFYALPLSINHGGKNDLKCALNKDSYIENFRNHEAQMLYDNFTDSGNPGYEVVFTYDVIFRDSVIPFSSRWDHYMHLENDQIHWFSLINSGLIILIFSIIVLYIFTRALKRDIEIYNTVRILY
jgi:transmembrane 9 superfamily protein 2/4